MQCGAKLTDTDGSRAGIL